MPTYTFTLPVAARGSIITISNELTGVTVDTIAIAASSGTVSTVTAAGPEIIVTSTLDVGEYVADAAVDQTWRRTEYHAEGVLDVPASLQALPDTFVSNGTIRLQSIMRAALANIATQPIDHMGYGDSITVGFGSSGVGKRWMDLVRDDVRVARPSGATGGFGFLAVGDGYPTFQPYTWELSGGAALVAATLGQPNNYYVQLNAAGETLTLPFTGTGIRLHFINFAGGDASQATVTIDGNAVTAPAFGTTSGTLEAAYRDYTGLTAGAHTLVLTHGAGTNDYRITGAMIYNGDYTSGWRTISNARSGAGVNTVSGVERWFTAYTPKLVTIYYGTNEYRLNTAIDTFRTNLAQMVQRAQTYSPGAAILLVKGYQPAHSTTPVAPWSAYRAVVDQVAFQSGAAVVDLVPAFGTGIPSAALSADSVHPTDLGHRAIADLVLDAIGL